MKIVRIIARLNIGGPAIHVVLLTRGLQERGHDSHLLAGPVPEAEGSMEYYAADRDVQIERIHDLVRPLSLWKDLCAFWTIYLFLRREKPDIVHTHTSKAGTLGRIAAFLARTPVIFHTFHGNVFDGYFSPSKTRIFLGVERALARITDRVITVSQTVKQQLHQVYRIAPADKILVVPLGFELAGFTDVFDCRQTDHIVAELPSELTLGWIGRFTEIKDPILFVRVAEAIKQKCKNIKFLMVGDGPLRAVVEKTVRDAGLSTEFEFMGWQRHMPEIYRRCDIVVSTSVNEGTPVAIIEGMAAGCPFVAPDVGGLGDLTDGNVRCEDNFSCYKNGLLVRKRDAQSFASAVLALVRDKELRARMSQAGHDFAVRTFGKDRLVRDTERLYQTFLVRKPYEPGH